MKISHERVSRFEFHQLANAFRRFVAMVECHCALTSCDLHPRITINKYHCDTPCHMRMKGEAVVTNLD